MEIVPIHYKPAMPVKNFRQIKETAQEMIELLDEKNFKGRHYVGHALSHAQVSEEPLSFFVVDQMFVGEEAFEDRIIINPKILEAPYFNDEKTEMREGIYKKGRKPNYQGYGEACLSFPFRSKKRVNRFDRIKVRYYIQIGARGLNQRTKWLSGLESQVFQHQFDHCQGDNIMHESPQF